jgi:hypothetical protein
MCACVVWPVGRRSDLNVLKALDRGGSTFNA